MARVTASRAICWIAWATPLLACRGPSIPGVDDELGSSGSDSESSSDSETGEEPFDVVDVHDQHGVAVARGITLADAATLRTVMGKRTSDLPGDVAHEAIHRDDLLLLV